MTYWLRRIFRKPETERQLDAELRFHLEQRIAERVAAGETPPEARRQSLLEFGGMEAIKQECRESRRVHFFEVLLQDLSYGLRMLRRNPGFSLVAILTLALGIGANTAIFSVVNGVLLNPLPYPHPEQLLTVHERRANFKYGAVSYPNFRDWQKENHVFSALAAVRSWDFSVTGMGNAEQVNGLFITSDLFPLLGIKPILGRALAAGEDEIGATPVVLISQGLWERKFGATGTVLGKSITLDGRSYSIIGVMPGALELGQDSVVNDVYVPLGQWNNPMLRNRVAGLGIHLLARLNNGVTLQQAAADMDRVAANLAVAYPVANKGTGATLLPLRQRIVGHVEPFLIVLCASVGFVLLIACVNVANLLLARSIARKREFAVRVALGAPARRVLRQLLTESMLLSGLGGLTGLGLALWATPLMLRAMPDALPRAEAISVDAHVLVFTIVISVFCGFIFGLFPALRLSAATTIADVKEGDLRSGRGLRAQNSFVAVETALALVLLIGAGLMIRSLAQLWKVNPGFNSHKVLTFSIALAPPMMKARPDAIRAAFRELQTRLRATPGVEAVSLLWGAVPMQGDDEELFWMDGHPKPSSIEGMNWALSYAVGPEYLKVMQIPLLRGRFFRETDDEHSPLVVVIDEALAKRFFPGREPLGQRIHVQDYTQPAEIIGIVKHVKHWGLDTDDQQSLQAQLYRPFMQLPPELSITLSPRGTGVVVRVSGEPSSVLDSIRTVVTQMNRDQVVFGAETMDEIISSTLATRRYSMFLLAGFAALALLLAAIGIFGVMSYAVGQRTREIGIRMALGARRGQVLSMIISQGAKMLLLGVAAGLLAAFALSHLISRLLFGVSPTDPLTFAAVAILLGMIALLACYIPARRAASVDPTLALRCE
ncbi:MAG: ADOP family duplicated permease [Actinomycetota bacterium]